MNVLLTPRIRVLSLGCLLATLLGLAGCSSTGRLGQYGFEDKTTAVIAAVPPRAYISSGFGEAWVSRHQPVRTAMRVGTYLAKRAEMQAAQTRLDSAQHLVDVAELVARHVLVKNQDALGYTAVSNPKGADYVIDVRIFDYGISAESWTAGTYFVIDGVVVLFDNETKREIWSRKLREREPITDSVIGLGATVGNVLTAHALSQLTVEEMATGLENLAQYTAGRVSAKLRDDFLKSRPEVR